MLLIHELRHEKEKSYLLLMKIMGAFGWLMLFFFTFGFILFYLIPVVFFIWLMSLYFKAVIYGDSVKVSANQYPEIYKIANDFSQQLGLTQTPDIFIYNGNGLINAFALKFLSRKYVILMSGLVDLMLKRGKVDELSMIIGHELAHHAAKHTDPLLNVWLKPATFVPFLGAAYSRACELTADRIGFELTQNLPACRNALVAIALGSESLANDTNIEEFVAQEREIPELMGFIHRIYSTHPRMTTRIIEITNYDRGKNLRLRRAL